MTKKSKLIVLTLIIIILALDAAIYFVYRIPDRNSAPRILTEIGGDGQLNEPTFAVADNQGRVYVADSGNHIVKVFDKKGKLTAEIGGPGSQKPLVYPYGIGLLDKDRILVADTGAGALYEYDVKGNFRKVWLQPASKAKPAGVYIDQKRQVYVSDLAGKRILVFSPGGQLQKTLASEKIDLGAPLGIAVDQDGMIWVADGANNNVKQFSPVGEIMRVFDGGPKDALGMAKGLAIDKEGRLYVADTMANRVRVFDKGGNYLYSLGKGDTGRFLFPNGLSIDNQDRIYVAYQSSNVVQVWGWER